LVLNCKLSWSVGEIKQVENAVSIKDETYWKKYAFY